LITVRKLYYIVLFEYHNVTELSYRKRKEKKIAKKKTQNSLQTTKASYVTWPNRSHVNVLCAQYVL